MVRLQLLVHALWVGVSVAVRAQPPEAPEALASALEIEARGAVGVARRSSHADGLSTAADAEVDQVTPETLLAAAKTEAKAWAEQARASNTWVQSNSAAIKKWFGVDFVESPTWDSDPYWVSDRLDRLRSIIDSVRFEMPPGKYCSAGVLASTIPKARESNHYSCTVSLCDGFFDAKVNLTLRAKTLLHEVLHCAGVTHHAFRKEECLNLTVARRVDSVNNYFYFLLNVGKVPRDVEFMMMNSQIHEVSCSILSGTFCEIATDRSCKMALDATGMGYQSCTSYCEAHGMSCRRASSDTDKPGTLSCDAGHTDFWRCGTAPANRILRCWCSPREYAYTNLITTTTTTKRVAR